MPNCDAATNRFPLFGRFAPTLTYQIAFPRAPRIRWFVVVGILIRLIIAVAIFTFLIAQVVGPALSHLVLDLEAANGTYTYQMMGEYWLRLSVANTYLWLLMFYAYFHLYLNLFAEVRMVLRCDSRRRRSSRVSAQCTPFPLVSCCALVIASSTRIG